MTARYLVQTRGHGEPWRTVVSVPSLALAASVADKGAAETYQLDSRTCHRHPYVRVVLRGAVVYDPRAEQAVTA